MIEAPPAATVLPFSYGTLQDKAVQVANYQRELSGVADSLPGYSAAMIAIHYSIRPSPLLYKLSRAPRSASR